MRILGNFNLLVEYEESVSKLISDKAELKDHEKLDEQIQSIKNEIKDVKLQMEEVQDLQKRCQIIKKHKSVLTSMYEKYKVGTGSEKEIFEKDNLSSLIKSCKDAGHKARMYDYAREEISRSESRILELRNENKSLKKRKDGAISSLELPDIEIEDIDKKNSSEIQMEISKLTGKSRTQVAILSDKKAFLKITEKDFRVKSAERQLRKGNKRSRRIFRIF